MNSLRRNWLLNSVFFIFALITTYVQSQLDLTATIVEVTIAVLGVLIWRKKRPHDFTVASSASRVFICLSWALIFFGSYLILRTTQPENYRLPGLVALGILCLLLAAYFGSIGKKHWITE